MQPEEYNDGNFVFRHYRVDPQRLIVSFASIGHAGLGEPIEEFRRTLEAFGTSCVFVTDLRANWYNSSSINTFLNRLADLCESYPHVGVLGESMGGSGAILFSNFFQRADRVLAMGPQFSVAEPFIRFDDRYNWISPTILPFCVMDFGTSPIKERCHLLYGDGEWRDYLHRSMFEASGFVTTTVAGAAHEVAGFLKKIGPQNRLMKLIDAFTDFDQEFTKTIVENVLQVTPAMPLANFEFPRLSEISASRSSQPSTSEN